MRNSETKIKLKTCKGCGNELKEKSSSKLCYDCLCTVELVQKGIAHIPSHKAVKAEKQIFTYGYGWLDSLMNKTRK